MNVTKIIKATAVRGRTSTAAPIIKEDYGLYLLIGGIDLPEVYEVDFSNEEHAGTSVTMVGNADGVLIPTQFIKSGKDVFAFYYQVGEDFGRTLYTIRIPNKLRPDRTNEAPTPEEQSVIDQTIAALNNAVEKTSADAEQTANDATRAEKARDRAESARDRAETAATNAATSETNAADSAETATAKASEASQAASNANRDADRAEQAAAQNGYMWFYIEDGKLYMDRTSNTKVDFYMQDGKLYVEEVA